MTKREVRHKLSAMRLGLRRKIDVLTGNLRVLARTPALGSAQVAEKEQKTNFLLAEIDRLEADLQRLARGTRRQRRAGWGFVPREVRKASCPDSGSHATTQENATI